MKIFFIAASTLALMVAFTSHSHAAIVDSFDHTYITDTETKLDWLDVTLSVNRTYTDVSSQFGTGGEFEGWRYASGDEFNILVGNFTGDVITEGDYSRINQEVNKIDALVVLLGSTLDSLWLHDTGVTWDADHGYVEGDGYDYTRGMLSDVAPNNQLQWHAALFDYDAPAVDDSSFAHAGSYAGSFTVTYDVGSYLVRDTISEVPLPPTAFMFAPSLLGLMGLRIRAKKQNSLI